MKSAKIPKNEAARLETLHKYQILDTPPEMIFDELTILAAYFCEAPMATITLIDEDREWYKSRVGVSDEQASRQISFCAHTILGDDLFIVPDTLKDKRFIDNPFVLDEPPLRFYAGAPLITPDGFALGTLCVFDQVPRELTERQINALRIIAHQVMIQLEFRRMDHEFGKDKQNTENIFNERVSGIEKLNNRLRDEINARMLAEIELVASEKRLTYALNSAQVGTWDWNVIMGRFIWNQEHEKIFGFAPGAFNGTHEQFQQRIHPDDIVGFNDAINRSKKEKTQYLHEYRIVWPDNSIHWVQGAGRFVFDNNNRPVRMYGVVMDITERKEAQLELSRTVRALRVLSRCNEVLTNITNEKKLLKEICRIAVKDGGYRFAWVGYPQHDAIKTVLPMAHAGYEAGYLKNLITWEEKDKHGQGPIGRVLRTKEKVVIRNFTKDPTLKPWHKSALERGYASGVALPLVSGNEIIGALMIYAAEEDAFDADEVRLLEELADNLALGVRTLRIAKSLQKTRQEAERQQEFIGALGKQALSSTNINRLMDRAVQQVTEILHVEYVKILELLPASNNFLLKAGIGFQDSLVGKAIIPGGHDSWAGYTLLRKEPVTVDDFKTEKRFSGPRLLHDYGVVSGMSVIIGEISHPYGVLGVHTRNHRVFSEHDTHFLESVANILAEAIRHEQAKKILLLEKNVLEFMSSDQPLNATLNNIIHIIEGTFPGMLCSILFLDEEGKHLLHGSAPSLPEQYNKAIHGIAIGPNVGCCGTASFLKKQVIVPDINKDPLWKDYRELAQTYNLRACWSTPLFYSNEKVMGTFANYYYTPKSPSTEELYAIERLAQIISIAIERIKAQQKLQKSEERYRAFYDDNPSMYFTVDPGGVILSVNSFGADQLGYTVKELIGKPLQIILPAEEQDVVMKHIDDCLGHAKELRDWETQKIHKTGRIIWVKESARAVETPDGITILTVCRDITERRRADEALREQSLALANAMPGISRLDTSGRYVTVNGPYAAMLGFQPEELIGRSWIPMIHPDDLPLAQAAYEHVVQEGRGEFEARAVRKDGSFFFKQVLMVKIVSAGGEMTGHYCFMRDITERKETEKAVLQSRERLRNLTASLHAIREEERTRISREIHDELGQALTGLRIDLAWLLGELSPRQNQLAERTRKALLLVDETLDTVRRISHDLRPAMLDDLGLETAIEWQMEEFQLRTSCQCELNLNAGDIGLDQHRDTVVFRILQEALTNIARHAKASRVAVNLHRRDGELILEIMDDGVGVSEAVLASNQSIGMIGMRERAGMLGGHVKINRTASGGTQVTLSVPLEVAYAH